jgi:hypothetical protein
MLSGVFLLGVRVAGLEYLVLIYAFRIKRNRQAEVDQERL